MTILKTTAIAVLAAFVSHTALAHDFKAGDLSIAHPMSFATPPGATTGAGYMEITNNGAEDDRLVAVKSDFPKTMIHETTMVDGIMKMRHQMGGVIIPAGETVTFEPGGLHVMFMGLDAPLKEGEKNAATLVFENSGSVDVKFNVEKRKVKAMDHSDHGKKMDHSDHSN
jgi:copper(I)-binding protein